MSNATFDGSNTTLAYRLRAPRAPLAADSLTVTYRSKHGGTLLHVVSDSADEAFTVAVFRRRVSLHWRLGGALPQPRHLRASRDPADWTTLRFTLTHNSITGECRC